MKLELTESLLMQDPDQAATALALLKDTGAKLAIDDFGTGYSSLSYLHRFPFDTLKIDRAFVSRMREDEGAMQLVRSIIDMARGMGMDTVAEGIEEPEELALLGDMGCEMAQGFLLAKPMAEGKPVEQAEDPHRCGMAGQFRRVFGQADWLNRTI